jgi:hypothetical protein
LSEHHVGKRLGEFLKNHPADADAIYDTVLAARQAQR